MLFHFLPLWATVSWQARRILVSVYGMTQQMRCQMRGTQQSDLVKPLESMEQLIIHNCSPDYLVRGRTVEIYILPFLLNECIYQFPTFPQ